MVSPKPLSDFVPDVTLIAFPIPGALPRAVAEHFPHANRALRFASRNGPDSDVLILILRAKPGAGPNSLWLN
jgi:hypothetical protein